MKRWHPHSISTFLMVLLLMFGLAMPGFAEEWLDPTFGENGKVTTAFGEYTTDEVRVSRLQGASERQRQSSRLAQFC